MTLVAFPLDLALGWRLVVQLGLFSACFELIQVLRDHDVDKAAGVRTTAVLLGPKRTLWVARALMVFAALYASLFLHPWIGLWLLLAAALPCAPSDTSGYWNRVRLVQGLGWLAILVAIGIRGGASGLF
jgi:4-hydroxybenzoate polyprenyltransferase